MSEYIYVWSGGVWCDEGDILEYLDVHGPDYSMVSKESEYACEIMTRSSNECT